MYLPYAVVFRFISDSVYLRDGFMRSRILIATLLYKPLSNDGDIFVFLLSCFSPMTIKPFLTVTSIPFSADHFHELSTLHHLLNKDTIKGMTNYSLYAIPAAWVLSIAPHFYAVSLANKVSKFDNTNPRHAAVDLAAKMSKEQLATFERAEAAQQNGFENLPFFAAAVLAGNLAGLGSATLNHLSAIYLASR